MLIRNNKRKYLQLQMFAVTTKPLFPMLLCMLRSWENGEVHFQDCLSELRFCVLFAAYKTCAGIHKLSSLPFFGCLVEHSLTQLHSLVVVCSIFVLFLFQSSQNRKSILTQVYPVRLTFTTCKWSNFCQFGFFHGIKSNFVSFS